MNREEANVESKNAINIRASISCSASSANILVAPPKISFTCEAGVKLFYEGMKFLWKTRLTIDIYIFRHFHSSPPTFEIVCYNPKVFAESPRVYCSVSTVLMEAIDLKVVDEILNAKKEMFLRQKKEFVIDCMREDIITDLVAQYLLSRIHEVESTLIV